MYFTTIKKCKEVGMSSRGGACAKALKLVRVRHVGWERVIGDVTAEKTKGQTPVGF